MLYPLTFRPIFKERLWGGRSIERLYGKKLPVNLPIGESWEISDRPGDVSVIDRGPLQGCDLHWLVEHQRAALLGAVPLVHDRFPLLVKILDARETLSVQVHPPSGVAAKLNGDPKTEFWFVAEADPGAELFAGLRRGVSRAQFEAKLKSAAVADCIHRLKVKAGDGLFVPSGRVHALGAGLVVFEVQQNSDSTYRVFDWNRVGPDGKGRELHLRQSLECIDFDDVEPTLAQSGWGGSPDSAVRPLASNEFFEMEVRRLSPGTHLELGNGGPRILGVVEGQLHVADEFWPVQLCAGQFCLLPASLGSRRVTAETVSEFLVVRPK